MIDSDALPLGKAPPELLAALAGADDRDLLQGPGIGRDAAIIDWGDRALVATADPITFVDSGAARLAVAINANDILAVGAEPRWLLATVLAPVATSRSELRELLDSLREACDEAQIALVGGHTEVTDAVSRTVVSCALIGVAPRGEIVLSDGAQAGDFVLQAGAAAVEGTALLGHPQLLDEPGVSIAAAARALRGIAGVHAMHDVTEGGIATAAGELAEAAGLGVELRLEAIDWLAETLDVCAERGLDPLGLLGSGTLLASVAPGAVDAGLAALSRAGVRGAVVGRIVGEPAATLVDGTARRPLPRFAQDEALRALAADRDAPPSP